MLFVLAAAIATPTPIPLPSFPPIVYPTVVIDETSVFKRPHKWPFVSRTFIVTVPLFGHVFRPLRFREILPEHLVAPSPSPKAP